ncbi:MAG: cytochrome c [Terriglobales bacterium]|jgi:mono/diheme cytochrome c family protein
MRNFIFGIIIVFLAVILGGLAAINFGWVPTRADATPPAWETRIASNALDASMERHAPRIANPVPPTDENLIEGMKIYTMNCAVCHGTLDLKPSPLEHSLYPPPPQLILMPPDDPEWHIYYSVRTGVRYSGMPAWNKTLSDDELWKVTAFLTRLDKLPPNVQDYWKKAFGTGPLPAGADAGHDSMQMKSDKAKPSDKP